ncbi:hypothetical protein HDU84_007977 [Entophlyctis sp. JEL0112]|nr:hypothetical protein HDU84_007977 [Entophlyctis sp. JEL0112]
MTSDSAECQVVFKGLTFTVPIQSKDGRKKVVTDRTILKVRVAKHDYVITVIKGYHGGIIFKARRFTAVMGASGAGKTSFLNLLAGEMKIGNMTGEIKVNSVPVTGAEMKDISGFVFQDDIILPTMTVSEAIMMSATLRLPKTVTVEERKKRVKHIINELNLQKCKDTIIGDTHIKGVSGGERKRCAMAMVK